MSLSFQEKSLWLMFVSLIGVFCWYFRAVLPTETVDVMPHQIVLFVLAVVMLVMVQVAGHIVLAIVDRRTRNLGQTDERDRWIGLLGTRNAAYVLASGVFFSLCAALVTKGNFLFVHLLLAFWVLAQLVEIGSQLFLYRRGA